MTAAGLLQVTLVETSAALRFKRKTQARVREKLNCLHHFGVCFLIFFLFFCECMISVPRKSIDEIAIIKQSNYAKKNIVHVSNSHAQCDVRV